MQLNTLFKAHKTKLSFTVLLILVEAGLALLFPLFIGKAIDKAIDGSYQGAVRLGILGLAALIVGVFRRVFDSRFYAKVYQQIGLSSIDKMKSHSPSVKSARLGMIRELVEFLENSLPELVGNVIGLVGVVFIIATLNLSVFSGSLLLTALVFFIYWLSSKKTVQLNKGANDEAEKQVEVLTKNDSGSLRTHLSNMMKWNIKLSDMEALNFSISWIALMFFLVLSIVVVVGNGMVQYGALFSLIMYVFQYMENVLNLPLFYQSWLRLREITSRLSSGPS